MARFPGYPTKVSLRQINSDTCLHMCSEKIIENDNVAGIVLNKTRTPLKISFQKFSECWYLVDKEFNLREIRSR